MALWTPSPTMNGPKSRHPGEFDSIACLLRPLTRGDPAALDLLDDAAVMPGRSGFDLVLSQDAMTAGVHFLPETPLDLVGRRLLRAALSDLAAKAAKPFSYLLTVAWPDGSGWAAREALANGLAQDGDIFGVSLIGGDTVSTPGPFMASVTVLGWSPAGAMVRRGGAQAGDLLVVSGTIGDGHLGLLAAKGEIAPDRHLLERFYLPQPRFDLAAAIQGYAHASADVSDGFLADAHNIAVASGLKVVIDLDRLPLSKPASVWLEAQVDGVAGLAGLASGGDDYEIVMAVPPDALGPFRVTAGAEVAVVGRFEVGEGAEVQFGGAPVRIGQLGWSHG